MNLARLCFQVWTVVLLVGSANLVAQDSSSWNFFVNDEGNAILGPDGAKKQQLGPMMTGAGDLSPDGNWIVFSEVAKRKPGERFQSNMIIQSRSDPKVRTAVPEIWGQTGSSFLPIWSRDSQRILICEQGTTNEVRKSAYRIYDRVQKTLTEVNRPMEPWPSDWSHDEKRILTSLDGRVAWVNLDGTGDPELITPPLETAYGARLSPDGKRILCMAALRNPDPLKRIYRLSVYDLETKKRSFADEPGHTHGYCWSPDSSQVAYTWQPSLDNPADTPVRETFLMTCNADGSDRKTLTSRKYELRADNSSRNGIVWYFIVWAWR